MFIVVTIACIWLAIVATRARNQQQAVDKIQKLGGILHFDYQRDAQGRDIPSGEPAAPQWLRRAVGEDYFRRVVTVDFNFGGGDKATDEDLAVFRSLPDVTILELNNNPDVSDAGLEHLSGLSKLRVLYLHRSNVKGPGIRHLPDSLVVLDLGFTPLEDEGLVHLKNMRRLKFLRLSHTNVTDEGISNLSGLVALEELALDGTDVTDAGLDHVKTIANLKQLSIGHTNVTAASAKRLQQTLPNCTIFPELKWLDARPEDKELWPDGYKPSTAEILAKIGELGDADVKVDTTSPEQPIISFRLFDSTISDESLIRLLAEMPELEQLNLRRVLVGDRLAKELPRLSKLWFLSLDDSRITDDGLAYIGQLASLKKLSLSNTKISDAGLMKLAGLKNLEAVYTQNCELSNEGYARFKNALPKCRISQ